MPSLSAKNTALYHSTLEDPTVSKLRECVAQGVVLNPDDDATFQLFAEQALTCPALQERPNYVDAWRLLKQAHCDFTRMNGRTLTRVIHYGFLDHQTPLFLPVVEALFALLPPAQCLHLPADPSPVETLTASLAQGMAHLADPDDRRRLWALCQGWVATPEGQQDLAAMVRYSQNNPSTALTLPELIVRGYAQTERNAELPEGAVAETLGWLKAQGVPLHTVTCSWRRLVSVYADRIGYSSRECTSAADFWVLADTDEERQAVVESFLSDVSAPQPNAIEALVEAGLIVTSELAPRLPTPPGPATQAAIKALLGNKIPSAAETRKRHRI